MNQELAENPLERIGAVAGDVWHYLDRNGPVSLTVLIRELESPRDSILMAIGWLAREGKVRFVQQARKRLITLVPLD